MDKQSFDTKVLATYTFPSEAYLIKNYLENEGIACVVTGEYLANTNIIYSNADGGVKLIVRKADYDKAMVVLSDMNTIPSDIECSECGSNNVEPYKVPQKSFLEKIKIFLSIIIFSWPINKNTNYVCNDCGNSFDHIV